MRPDGSINVGTIFPHGGYTIIAAWDAKVGYSKTNYFSSRSAVYYNPKTGLYITSDNTGHVGGAWKGATSVANLGSDKRTGTYDINMNKIAK